MDNFYIKNLYKDIIDRKDKIAVVGLGYVGMPLAVEFAKKTDVIGFDIDEKKIQKYKEGIDFTNEVGNDVVKKSSVEFTADESRLDDVKFFIIAVPTPINLDKTPDLTPVILASQIVSRHLSKGAVVVYESTVYPGTTEEICVPILEKGSKLEYISEFKVGYSPERINPSDKINTVKTIKKIVSACDNETLDVIANVYEIVVEGGTYKASCIKVAEAAKVVENSQRDINIAFMNELSMVFDVMGIDTNEVVEAMSTKWNALNFKPGLVGGHCIGVDPYYFIYKAEQLGYHSQIIMSGRKINDSMSGFVVNSIIKRLIKADKKVKGAKVAVLGITFKENCPDIRNTKVTDIVSELNSYEIDVILSDCICDKNEVRKYYELEVSDFSEIKDVDAVVVAVAHDEYAKLSFDEIEKLYGDGEKVLIDIKGIFNRKEAEKKGFIYWSL